MTKYVIRRIAQAIPVLFGISIAVYAILLAAPGGPTAKFASNPRMTHEQKEQFKQAWGLDQPIPVQYCRWIGVCNPDERGHVLGILPAPAALLGPTGWPNFLPEGRSRAPRTASSTATSATRSTPVRRSWTGSRGPPCPTFILACVRARHLAHDRDPRSGSTAAVKRYSWFDQAATIFAYVGFAMPTFWLGIMLIFIFSGPGLNILPASGMTETRLSPPFGSDAYWVYFGAAPDRGPRSTSGRHLILPVITLVVVNIAGDSRFVRASMLEALEPGLRPDGQGQGPVGPVGHLQARAAQRACCRS